MALSAQQEKTRRTLLLTFSIAVVLWASDSRDGIQWIIDLAGWKAWLFLLVTHLYHAMVWKLDRNLIFVPERKLRGDFQTEDSVLGREAAYVRRYLARELTDIAVVFGGLIMVGNFLVQLGDRNVGAPPL